MRAAWILAIGSAAGLAACMTLDEIAPPVDRLAPAAPGAPDRRLDALARGRALYVVDCARCHAVVPVRAHSRAQWEEILPRMVKESNLGAEELRALEAYIEAVLESPPGQGTTARP